MEEKCATNKNTSSTINEKEDDLAREKFYVICSKKKDRSQSMKTNSSNHNFLEEK